MKCYIVCGYNNFASSITGDYVEEWMVRAYLKKNKAEKIKNELNLLSLEMRSSPEEARKKLKEIDPHHVMSGNDYYVQELGLVDGD